MPELKPRKLPRQARSQATVEAILEGCARILGETGYAGLSTNQIARRADSNGWSGVHLEGGFALLVGGHRQMQFLRLVSRGPRGPVPVSEQAMHLLVGEPGRRYVVGTMRPARMLGMGESQLHDLVEKSISEMEEPASRLEKQP